VFLFLLQFFLPYRDLCPIWCDAVVEEPPYEVTETGWGEFDVEIKIFFVDPIEKPLVLQHTLRLFHPDGAPLTVDRPVVSENYDELIFQDPTEQFYRRLISGTVKRVESHLTPYCTVLGLIVFCL
jgi:transcription initiation factor IIF auxiliary subunit